MIRVKFKLGFIVGAIGLSWVATSACGQTLMCKESLATRGVVILTSASASGLDSNPNVGVFFSPEELAVWRRRAVSGPFAHNNDYTLGSPGDWDRIKGRAESFVSQLDATGHAGT